ncbi:arginine deiminase-related protein [Cobetia sp. 10Alg 146]|uniref:citrulline utilization hydrolase CtlX n=1 Tax=Cobetia sp. 10Alg 146 TaxID=3040019 RepID=UPI0024496EAA|nr:arginine deiminase-related protein [Cobetia sp. 10Alg 146]MDH2292371.1 arginine deiminase-related protein [Cobetia sp. 10Alg 146]
MSNHLSSVQAPSAIVMVRPHHFVVNAETALDNAFQIKFISDESLVQRAYEEHSVAVKELEHHGVRVHVFEGDNPETPDSVFPNNWFSTHPGGHVAIYPMKANNRRKERRIDVIEMLKEQYRVQDVIDYSGLESDGLYLEGTGAMVIDHIDRVAYAVESDRTNPLILERFCTHFNFDPMVFSAADSQGVRIYHTNVLMCIATDYALIGEDMIVDKEQREAVVSRLKESGRHVISLNEHQIASFAGNAIELQGREGRLLALSKTAFDSLHPDQISIIQESTRLVPLSIPTIEKAGGSVRCTIAGIHLSSRYSSAGYKS